MPLPFISSFSRLIHPLNLSHSYSFSHPPPSPFPPCSFSQTHQHPCILWCTRLCCAPGCAACPSRGTHCTPCMGRMATLESATPTRRGVWQRWVEFWGEWRSGRGVSGYSGHSGAGCKGWSCSGGVEVCVYVCLYGCFVSAHLWWCSGGLLLKCPGRVGEVCVSFLLRVFLCGRLNDLLVGI
jgi:hypothetical protein